MSQNTTIDNSLQNQNSLLQNFDVNTFNKYHILGSGTYGIIRKVPINGKYYACRKSKDDVCNFVIYNDLMIIPLTQKHPYLTKIYESRIINDTIWTVMELCDCNLHMWLIGYNFVIPKNRRLELLDGLISGLEFLNSNGLVHNDFSLSNILITGLPPNWVQYIIGGQVDEKVNDIEHLLEHSKNNKVARRAAELIENKSVSFKITDFGFVYKITSPKKGFPNITQHFQPPELIFGPHSDVMKVDTWSLGAVYYSICTNRLLISDNVEHRRKYSKIPQLVSPNLLYLETLLLIGDPTSELIFNYGLWPHYIQLAAIFGIKIHLPKENNISLGLDKDFDIDASVADYFDQMIFKPNNHDKRMKISNEVDISNWKKSTNTKTNINQIHNTSINYDDLIKNNDPNDENHDILRKEILRIVDNIITIIIDMPTEMFDHNQNALREILDNEKGDDHIEFINNLLIWDYRKRPSTFELRNLFNEFFSNETNKQNEINETNKQTNETKYSNNKAITQSNFNNFFHIPLIDTVLQYVTMYENTKIFDTHIYFLANYPQNWYSILKTAILINQIFTEIAKDPQTKTKYLETIFNKHKESGISMFLGGNNNEENNNQEQNNEEINNQEQNNKEINNLSIPFLILHSFVLVHNYHSGRYSQEYEHVIKYNTHIALLKIINCKIDLVDPIDLFMKTFLHQENFRKRIKFMTFFDCHSFDNDENGNNEIDSKRINYLTILAVFLQSLFSYQFDPEEVHEAINIILNSIPVDYSDNNKITIMEVSIPYLRIINDMLIDITNGRFPRNNNKFVAGNARILIIIHYILWLWNKTREVLITVLGKELYNNQYINDLMKRIGIIQE